MLPKRCQLPEHAPPCACPSGSPFRWNTGEPTVFNTAMMKKNAQRYMREGITEVAEADGAVLRHKNWASVGFKDK